MYIHLGRDYVLNDRDIIGIFNLETTTISPRGREFLNYAQKNGAVVSLSDELPQSYVLADGGVVDTVYLSELSSAVLRRRAEKEHFRIGKQGAEVYHRAYAYEQQQREKLRGYAGIEKGFNSLRIDKGQIDQYCAEAHGQKKRGLHFLFYGQIDERCAYGDHKQLLPREIGHV